MMQVTNRFQALQYLKKLPEDFYAVRVDVESLKDNSLRKLCRDLEKQLEVQQANLENDREFYEGYLKTLLDKEGFNTRDLSISLIVLGNKHGFLSGRIFNQGDFQKRIIDVKQFNDSYPIFIDTSTMKFLETGKTSDQIKREREETFSHDPEPKLIRVETVDDLQAALAEQEIDYNKQIDDLKAKYHAAEETNQQLIQVATQNENTLMSQVNELRQINEAANQNQEILVNQINALKSKVQQLEVTRMDEDQDDDEDVVNDEINELRQVNENLRSKIDEISNQPQQNPARIMGFFSNMFEDEELDTADIAEQTAAMEAEEQKRNKVDPKVEKLSLSQMGISTWNPDTTSFLDYIISLRSIFNHYNITQPRAIHLLFSSLPSKYSYVRNAVRSYPGFEYNRKNYWEVENIVIEMVVGGKDKIFSEFMNLQKKKNENFIQYYQKVVDFYLFTQSNTIYQGQKAMESDPIAFKLVKDKMVKAIPNQLVPEFKRRIEGKTKLPEMFKAVLELREQFPETESFEPDYNGTNLNVLKQQKKPDWIKNVKCFYCGKKGHIKKDCYKRESKTKKSGISRKDKKYQK